MGIIFRDYIIFFFCFFLVVIDYLVVCFLCNAILYCFFVRLFKKFVIFSSLFYFYVGYSFFFVWVFFLILYSSIYNILFYLYYFVVYFFYIYYIPFKFSFLFNSFIISINLLLSQRAVAPYRFETALRRAFWFFFRRVKTGLTSKKHVIGV